MNNASCPIATLSSAVVLLAKQLSPKAVFLSPVVLSYNASYPIAVLSFPLFVPKAPTPNAVSLVPVVLVVNAL